MKAFYDDVGIINIESELVHDTIELEGVIYDGINNSFEVPSLSIRKIYEVKVGSCTLLLEMRGITKTLWFDENYSTNIPLGSFVLDGNTHFRMWAPTSQSCQVVIDGIAYKMSRMGHGVFEYVAASNLHGSKYSYKLMRNNQEHTLTDPYAIASGPNRSYSVVLDKRKFIHDKERYHAANDPIILEASVRDFSMDPNIPFKNRGKFLGLIESYSKYGMNHVVDLGVTHLQLMPINDFETVDELNPYDTYNWGYDTMQFMVLEGSYSSNVGDPFQGIFDFKKVVQAYHNEGIGINLDLVFNHVYEVETHPLHQAVPYYFFRYNSDYSLSNGSFCGNEIASEMTMMRRLIVETCQYFVEIFDVDGFRFDLMGLIDIETMNNVYDAINRYGKPVMLYGEGWSMPTVLPKHLEASMLNADKMPHIAHFNDKFRDYVGGKTDATTFPITSESLDMENVREFANAAWKVLGSPLKSINYIECHDNYTVSDRFKILGLEFEDTKLPFYFTIMSDGIPFLQIGQSFYRNKKGEENSYNLSDSINAIDWSYLDRYESLNEYVKELIATRKSNSKNYNLDTLNDSISTPIKTLN